MALKKQRKYSLIPDKSRSYRKERETKGHCSDLETGRDAVLDRGVAPNALEIENRKSGAFREERDVFLATLCRGGSEKRRESPGRRWGKSL